jgi:hypothetical protein
LRIENEKARKLAISNEQLVMSNGKRFLKIDKVIIKT